MLKSSGEISRLVGFVTSMVFSAAVIFACSFGMVGIFQALSTYDLDDMSAMADKDADAIVAMITGISFDEESFEGELINEMENIIYGVESREEYSFEDATKDAKNILDNFFGDFSTDSITGGAEDIINSITDLLGGEEVVKEYVDKYSGRD